MKILKVGPGGLGGIYWHFYLLSKHTPLEKYLSLSRSIVSRLRGEWEWASARHSPNRGLDELLHFPGLLVISLGPGGGCVLGFPGRLIQRGYFLQANLSVEVKGHGRWGTHSRTLVISLPVEAADISVGRNPWLEMTRIGHFGKPSIRTLPHTLAPLHHHPFPHGKMHFFTQQGRREHKIFHRSPFFGNDDDGNQLSSCLSTLSGRLRCHRFSKKNIPKTPTMKFQ